MKTLHLRCKDRNAPQGEWTLLLKNNGGWLLDPENQCWASFRHADAEQRFVFPSFWQSIKDLGIVTDEGDVLWFKPKRSAIAEIREYLGSALASQGAEAIRSVSQHAWLSILGGLAVLCFGTVGSCVSLAVAFGNSAGGAFVIAIGVIAAGGTWLAKGIHSLNRVRRAKRQFVQSGNIEKI